MYQLIGFKLKTVSPEITSPRIFFLIVTQMKPLSIAGFQQECKLISLAVVNCSSIISIKNSFLLIDWINSSTFYKLTKKSIVLSKLCSKF